MKTVTDWKEIKKKDKKDILKKIDEMIETVKQQRK